MSYPKLETIFKEVGAHIPDPMLLSQREAIDDKYDYLKNLRPAKTEVIEKIQTQTKESWHKCIKFLQELQNTYSDLHLAVEKVREEIAQQIEQELIGNTNPDPGTLITKYREKCRSELRLALNSKFTNEQIDPLAEYLFASLVGICALDWRPAA